MNFTQSRSTMADTLVQAEQSVASLGRALLQGIPERIQAATQELHDSAHALALVLRVFDVSAPGADDLRERLGRVAQDMAQQREALLRRSALVEQSLRSLVPQTQASTYSGALSRYARSAGAAFRQF